MNIQVFGQNELLYHIEKGDKIYSHCISITNPGTARLENDTSHRTPALFHNLFSEVLELKFWDSCRKELLIEDAEDKTIPTMEHINQVLNFVERTKKEATGYTIHCWQGISRSTAVAYGLLFYFLQDEKTAADELIRIRRNAMPLKLICELYDEIFGSNLSCLSKTIYMTRIEAMRKELQDSIDDVGDLEPV